MKNIGIQLEKLLAVLKLCLCFPFRSSAGADLLHSSEYNFYALTPKDDAEIGIYENALDFVFANNNVRNVAISGSYGAGKSSVLASYKKHTMTRNIYTPLWRIFTRQMKTTIHWMPMAIYHLRQYWRGKFSTN
ncbi:MAG: hypothetical protein LBQ86_06740 [Holophagales bacterium]|jgi:DNA replication protein DnaC|nr:hypothetical protein [Holophagales bacterium]